jgi:repressor LexA
MGRTPAGQTREKVFLYVRQRLLTGRPPTVREVQDHFGFLSIQTAREHLEKLVEEGRLGKEGGARGYVLPDSVVAVLVPVVGHVPAGGLSLAAEDLEGYVPFEGREGDDLFGLRVRGDSMRDAGILDGDLVIVRRQQTARTGEIVVALVGDEATVKVLHRSGRRVELRPRNPAYRPVVPRELRLLGKVIEVRRRYS